MVTTRITRQRPPGARDMRAVAGELNVKAFGAQGDYNPATGVGTDDTAAFQTWLTALAASPHLRGKIPDGIFKITGTLTTGVSLNIVGAGYRSILWFAAGNATDLFMVGGANTVSSEVILKSFVILGGANCGRYAITGGTFGYADINLRIEGGWQALLWLHRTTSGIGGTVKGSMEICKVRIICRHASTFYGISGALIGDPVDGVSIYGWANAVNFDLDLTSCSGYGLYLEGSYGAAFTCSVEGSFQGIGGTAIRVIGGYQTRLRNIYTEGPADPAIYLSNCIEAQVGPYAYGNITLTDCTNTRVEKPSGYLLIESGCVGTDVVQGGNNNTPMLNQSLSTVATGHRRYNTIGQARFPTASADTAPHNLVANGGMRRFIAGASHTNIWGWTGGLYVATQCGVGLADTTHTGNSPYSAKVERRVGQGSTAKQQVFAPGELAGLVGQQVWVSMQVKTVSETVYAQFSPTSSGISLQEIVTGKGVTLADGFELWRYCYLITAAMVTDGATLSIHVPPNGASNCVAYIGEVMAGIGNSAPPAFNRAVRHHTQAIEYHESSLHAWGTAAPISGGDTLFNQDWQVGDVLWNSAPSAGGILRWVCVTAGSPGTWRAEPLLSQALFQTLTYAATVTPDVAAGAVAKLTLTGNVTIAAPTNAFAGATLVLKLVQDGTGGRTVAWNAAFKNPPTVDTAANAITTAAFVYDGSEWS